MPVKLTSGGKPLAPPPAAEPPTAPVVETKINVVDHLLENADSIPHVQPPATADVGKAGKDGVVTVDTTEKVVVPPLADNSENKGAGRVTYGMAATVNIGNFENVRPFVQIEVSFMPGQQDAAYAFAEGWVDARINNIVSAVKASVSGA